jgi:predicted transposase/invertase (TIGR01784 family)
MRIGIDPLIDCAFKKLFGSTENKNLSIELINAILQEGGEKTVVDIEILNSYNPKNFIGDKLSIVDIKAKNELGEWFIIEVQIQMMEYFPQRILYYWAKTYQAQLQAGERYSLLKKVTLISICKNSLPTNTENYYNHFRILDTKNHIPLCDHLSIHTLELTKFLNTEKEISKPIEKWSFFLKHGENLDCEKLPPQLSISYIRQAAKELKMFTQNEIERELYNSRHIAILDKVSSLAEKYEKGREAGLQEGIQAIAVEMIQDGMEITQISRLTKLSPQEISHLKKQLGQEGIS